MVVPKADLMGYSSAVLMVALKVDYSAEKSAASTVASLVDWMVA